MTDPAKKTKIMVHDTPEFGRFGVLIEVPWRA